jgi:hypothetical protein
MEKVLQNVASPTGRGMQTTCVHMKCGLAKFVLFPQPTRQQYYGGSWWWPIDSKLNYVVLPLVEREALVRAFSPGSTLEPGLKVFRRRGLKCWLKTPPLVSVGVTNRDKRTGSQCHFPAMIDAGF